MRMMLEFNSNVVSPTLASSGVARNILVLRQLAIARREKFCSLIFINDVILRAAARKMVVPCVAVSSIATIAD